MNDDHSAQLRSTAVSYSGLVDEWYVVFGVQMFGQQTISATDVWATVQLGLGSVVQMISGDLVFSPLIALYNVSAFAAILFKLLF